MLASIYVRRALRRVCSRRGKPASAPSLAQLSLASVVIVGLLYLRGSRAVPRSLPVSVRAAAAPAGPPAHPPADPPKAVAPHPDRLLRIPPHTPASTQHDPLRSRVDAIVGEGEGARTGLTDTYAVPAPVVANMTHAVATRLYWKLVYTDVVSALRRHHDDLKRQPRFEAGARVLFIHPQNGLGNRLRAVASGLAMARGTRRVPVIVWERDAHLGAAFDDLFVRKAYGSDIDTVLYKDLIVMESFPSWNTVSQRSPHWHPVSYMEKDGGNAMPDALLRFSMPAVDLSSSEPKALMDSMGAVGDIDLKPAEQRQRPLSDHIEPPMHVYFRSAYVARTEPKRLSARQYVNRELAALPPSEAVLKIARTVDWNKLKSSIGVHIRARRLQNDNVDVNPNCEYSTVGAYRTDYWRHQSRLPVFEYKMKVTLQRDSKTNFFVAADDVATIRRLESVFPGRVQTISRKCDDRNPSCVLYAMADLLCLSKTRKIYGSNWSSFSEAAGRLGHKRIYLSGRDFGKETRSEKRMRIIRDKLWRLVDRTRLFDYLSGCRRR